MAFIPAPPSAFGRQVSASDVSCKSGFLGAFVVRRPRAAYNVNIVRAVSSNDFKTGTTIEMDGVVYRVVEFLHVKPGKGALVLLRLLGDEVFPRIDDIDLGV